MGNILSLSHAQEPKVFNNVIRFSFTWVLSCISIFLFFFSLSDTSSASENENSYKVVFESILIKDKHEDIPFSNAQWMMDVYVNEERIPLSSDSGLFNVYENQEVGFRNKGITLNIPANESIRIVTAGFEQDSPQNIVLPDISNELKQAIPTVQVSEYYDLKGEYAGIGGGGGRNISYNVSGSEVAVAYDIASKIMPYNTDDAIGIVSKEYSLEDNFGIGQHHDCSSANSNITNVQERQKTSCDFILKYSIIDVDQQFPIAKWHDWETVPGLSSGMSSIPGAATYAPEIFTVLGLNSDGKLLMQTYDHEWITPAEDIPRQTSDLQTIILSDSQPKIFTPAPDRSFLFALGADRSLYYNIFDTKTGGWKDWKKFGDSFVSSPTISVTSINELDLFALREDNYIYQRKYGFNEDKWMSEWKPITSFENQFLYPPALILPSGTLNRLDTFGLLDNGSLWHGIYTLVTTSQFNFGFGGERFDWILDKKEIVPNFSNFTFDSEPAVLSKVYGESMDLYIRDSNNTLRHAIYNYNSDDWVWEHMGNIYSSPVVISPGSGRTDIFSLNNTAVIHKWYGS